MPLFPHAAVIRQDGGYPRSAGYASIATSIDQAIWSTFRSNGDGSSP
jgi:hypothetical protein